MTGIIIPEGDGRRRCRDEEEVDPTNLRGKKLAAQKMQKKKTKQMVGTLMTRSGTLIPVPFTKEEEETHVQETLQWSVVER